MNVFQWATIGFAVFLILTEAAQFDRGAGRVRIWRFLRIAAWICVAVAVASPVQITQLARAVGIQRGADLVLYGTCLAFVWSIFLFYSRCMWIERRLTILVREQAIQGAIRGNEAQRTSIQPGEPHQQ